LKLCKKVGGSVRILVQKKTRGVNWEAHLYKKETSMREGKKEGNCVGTGLHHLHKLIV